MPSGVIVELDVGAGLGADLHFLGLRLLDRVEAVLLAVVALHCGGDAGVGLRHGRPHTVERHRGAHLVALLGGEQQHESATHAEADGPDLGPGDPFVRQQVVDGAAEVGRSLVDRQLAHHLAGLVGVVGHPPAVQVGREGHKTCGGEAVGNCGDVVVEPPPLLDHDDAGARAGRG